MTTIVEGLCAIPDRSRVFAVEFQLAVEAGRAEFVACFVATKMARVAIVRAVAGLKVLKSNHQCLINRIY